MMTDPKQGEIWLVNLDPIIGVEKGKKRPVVVVSNSLLKNSNIRITVPITHRTPDHEKYIWMLKVKQDSQNMLSKESTLDCMHIRSLDVKRFIKKIGKINRSLINDIKSILMFIT